jgi:cytosine/adenosine deaminase-related metal-dependent hydrolase
LQATVVIEDGQIARVDEAQSDAGSDLLIVPALADAHDHGRGLSSVAFGVVDQALELWLPLLGREPLVDPYNRAAVAFAKLALSGVAAINHCHNPQRLPHLVEEAAGVARAARDVGIRVAFAVPMRDRNYLAYGNTALLEAELGPNDFNALNALIVRYGVDEQLAWIDQISEFESPWFQVQYGPVGPQWCSDTLLARIAEQSALERRRIHMHLFETKRQREWADAQYPDGLIRKLDEIGLLSDRLTVAHGVWLHPDECELMASRGVTVSVNTSSNLRLHSGIAPVRVFRETGLAWAMGLDGMALDDDADALRELRLLWHQQQGISLEGAISTSELCRAIFVNGHRTITPLAGTAIEPGMAADLLLLDYAAMTPDVLHDGDELDVLINRGRKEHVRGLIVGGRKIVENGRVTSIDLPALEAELLAQARAGMSASEAIHPLRLRHHAGLKRYYGCDCHQRPEPA